MFKIGAHQSIAGGYQEALKRIVKIGGNTLQIFSASPRSWKMSNNIIENDCKQFISVKKKLFIDPIYFHASYLVNLADDGKIGFFSKKSLINELTLAAKLDVKGSIIHLGSFKETQVDNNFENNPKYKVLIKNIQEILFQTPKETLFIIENAGNRKIGQTLEELAFIIKKLNNDRIRLCLDTCHLFSNGYFFKSNKQLEVFLDKLKQLNLLDRLELWHLNDSRDPLNSGRDRHENIGQGKIGLEEFKILLNHPQTKNYPFIIETPGFDKQGPDKKNLDILKSLVK